MFRMFNRKVMGMRSRRMVLMTIGCLIALYVVSKLLYFTNTNSCTIDDVLARIDTQMVRYPQESYIVIPNLIPATLENYVFDDNEIAICTQTSLNNLYQVIKLSRTWDGTISVTVFSFGNEVSVALRYIILMNKCYENVRRKVSFHLVYPKSSPPKDLTSVYGMDLDCSTLQLIRIKHVEENYALNITYPANLLRNVAFMYSTSTYVLNLDVDFVPSKGMKKEMETFLKSRTRAEKQRKIAFVTPTFESKSTLYEPLSKKDLLRAVENGSVRQLGVKKCLHCQALSNYPKWLSLPYPSITSIGYYVNFKMSYEPIYIADRAKLPMFDPKFKQYGFDRSSQLCETYYSGYHFAVMNNLFVIHDGFKDSKQFYSWKQREHERNSWLFRGVFLPYLRMKYPHSNRTC